MEKSRIRHAQEFLIVHGLDGEKRLLDIECLLSLHPPETVIGLINDLIRDNKAKLKRLIRRDKSDPRVDQTISRIFRFKNCRRTLLNSVNSKNVETFPADAA